MNKMKKKRKKIFVFLFGLATAMLMTLPVQAQGLLENLLDEYYAEKEQQSNNNGGVMGRGSSGGYNLTNQQFGSDANGGYNLFNHVKLMITREDNLPGLLRNLLSVDQADTFFLL